jgi:hypothetical protein
MSASALLLRACRAGKDCRRRQEKLIVLKLIQDVTKYMA